MDLQGVYAQRGNDSVSMESPGGVCLPDMREDVPFDQYLYAEKDQPERNGLFLTVTND